MSQFRIDFTCIWFDFASFSSLFSIRFAGTVDDVHHQSPVACLIRFFFSSLASFKSWRSIHSGVYLNLSLHCLFSTSRKYVFFFLYFSFSARIWLLSQNIYRSCSSNGNSSSRPTTNSKVIYSIWKIARSIGTEGRIRTPSAYERDSAWRSTNKKAACLLQSVACEKEILKRLMDSFVLAIASMASGISAHIIDYVFHQFIYYHVNNLVENGTHRPTCDDIMSIMTVSCKTAILRRQSHWLDSLKCAPRQWNVMTTYIFCLFWAIDRFWAAACIY